MASPSKSKPPTASTSTSSAKRLSSKEKKIHEVCLNLSKQGLAVDGKNLSSRLKDEALNDIVDVCNALCRKRLLNLLSDKGTISWQVVDAKIAQQSGTLSDECNLILGLIRSSDDKGIWSRTLKSKSGLAQTLIAKSLKTLEGGRYIKAVKSVKFPTRKIYLLYDVTPSIELTGGPWYTGAELDSEFIGELKKFCLKIISQACHPTFHDKDREKEKDKEKESKYLELLMPVDHAPLLPNSHWIAEQIRESDLTPVPLSPEHVDALLEVLVMDGEIERLRIKRPEGDYDTAEVVEQGKKRKKLAKSSHRPNGQKKRRKINGARQEDSDAIDQESNLSDFIEDDMDDHSDAVSYDEDGNFKMNGKSSRSASKPGPPGRQKYYFVYRTINRANEINFNIPIGYTDIPCGGCPVASACDNKGKPAFQDLPAGSDLNHDSYSVASSTIKPSKQSLSAQIALRLKLKPPGSSPVDDTDHWRGGGTRGKQRVGVINPKDCIYLKKWLDGEEE